MKLKLITDIKGKKKGDTIEVKSDGNIPIDNFWFRRLKDKDVEIVIKSEKKQKQKNEEKE